MFICVYIYKHTRAESGFCFVHTTRLAITVSFKLTCAPVDYFLLNIGSGHFSLKC